MKHLLFFLAVSTCFTLSLEGAHGMCSEESRYLLGRSLIEAEQALQNTKIHFYERMVSEGHWPDTKEMAQARREFWEYLRGDEYQKYLRDSARRKRELREILSKAYITINKNREQILAGGLDNQQVAFINANIEIQSGERKRVLDALRKIDGELPGKVQAFMRVQEQRYNQLMESHPVGDLLDRDQPLHEFGEQIKKLEEQIANIQLR